MWGGRVAAVNGLLIEARGGLSRLAIGARVEITRLRDAPLAAEVVGFRESRALLMPFGPVEGIAPGAEIRIMPEGASIRPTLAWRGRIIDAVGEPIDGKGPLPQGPAAYPLRAPPPPAHARLRGATRFFPPAATAAAAASRARKSNNATPKNAQWLTYSPMYMSTAPRRRALRNG